MPGAAFIAGAAVAAMVIAADRLLAVVAARAAGRRIRAVAGIASGPVVRIGGTAFLAQLAAGLFREINVTVASFSAGGVELRDLAARLTQVRAPVARLAAGAGLVAGQVTATVTIPLSALAARLPSGLKLSSGGGELAVSGSVLLMPVSGILRIGAARQAITVTPRVLGVPSLVGFVIGLPGMPPELSIDSVVVTDAGLLVSVRGENVCFSGVPAIEPGPLRGR